MPNDYMRRKSEVYGEIKRISLIRNTPLSVRWTDNLQTMNDRLEMMRPSFLRDIPRTRQREVVGSTSEEYKYFQTNEGFRKYYVNNFNKETSDIHSIMNEVVLRLNHALRTGVTEGANVNITFKLFNSGIHTTKQFDGFLLRDIDVFRDSLTSYNDTHTANNVNYTYNIEKIIIHIIKENSGGCTINNKITNGAGVKFLAPKSKNNDCLFACFKELELLKLNEGSRKTVEKTRNNIRKEFGIEKGDTIPISVAEKIFNKYKKDGAELYLVDIETKKTYGNPSSEACIKLQNSHYEIVEKNEQKECEHCLTKYYKKHNCNADKVSFVDVKIKKKGRVLFRNPDFNQGNSILNNNDVLHYDIETVPVEINGERIHTPYIVGYAIGTDECKMIAGKYCMADFVKMLLRMNKTRVIEAEERLKTNEKYNNSESEIVKKRMIKEEIRPLYVNAFNGANFDHYFIQKEFISLGIKPEKFILNNGSIIKFQYENIHLFDICKHLQGSLKDNLLSFGCKILKGDFDHSKATPWEQMSEDLREKCKKYLKADVLGLKELYEKLNNSIYKKHHINITKYPTTSSLSFNLWKSAQNKNIKLPTLEQEQAFRQSVRGGRCYKSKHRFISKQYDDYINGDIGFDDVEDYLIDADVVSLYPTAMSKFPYPVGDCLRIPAQSQHEENFTSSFYSYGRMGIYYIKYKANKNLQHSIGGRRSETGLKWDLQDSEGWYTSVDIEDMIENGYSIKVLDGYYWTKTEYVFKDYIEELFLKKEQAKKGSVDYALAKLFMNALYGKMIQRPIYSKTITIKKNSEFWKFWKDHVITGIDEIPNENGEAVFWSITGTPRDYLKQERSITKPTHLGAFILAYSRRIMLNYIKEANPYFGSSEVDKRLSNDFYYTDTDSLQMHARNAKLIKNLGSKKLGGITDDLGDGCKIIKGIWISPKLYILFYIKKGSKELHYHMRGKGLNKDNLTVKSFEDMDKGLSLTNVRSFQIKKIPIKRNSKQQNISCYSLVHYDSSIEKDVSKLTRIVNSKQWDGRKFIGNDSIPH